MKLFVSYEEERLKVKSFKNKILTIDFEIAGEEDIQKIEYLLSYDGCVKITLLNWKVL